MTKAGLALSASANDMAAPASPLAPICTRTPRAGSGARSFVYDPKADRLDEVDAAGSAPFGTPWFYVDAELGDGRLVFGGSQGLLVVRPERYSPSIYAPPLVINGLRVDGVPQHPQALRQGLVLEAGTRSFGLDYAALDFAAPQRLRYRHRLVGLEPGWIEGGSDFRMPAYSNLAPGRYTLQLNASNHDGVWSPKVLELPIEVRAAWWQWPGVRALGLGLTLWAVWGCCSGAPANCDGARAGCKPWCRSASPNCVASA